MRNKVLESLWGNKVFKVVVVISLLTAVSLPAWLEASEGFVYKMLLFQLFGGLWMLSFLYLIDELKKVNDTIWRSMGLVIIGIWLYLSLYPGIISASEDGTYSLLRQPIIWMVVGTAVCYFAVLFYNRSRIHPE